MTNLRPRSCGCSKLLGLLFVLAVIVASVAVALAQQTHSNEELLALSGEAGSSGGRMVVSLRAEPKTLNPVVATDAPSQEVIGTMQADLVHINRATHLTEPALAKSWKVSSDGLDYTLTLRQGLRFSDGEPLDAEDVLFTLRVYLDEGVHAPQRDLLIVGGKPITVTKINAQTLVFHFAKPYGVGERVFDGLAILPRHLLEKTYQEGKLGQIGSLSTPANQWAGLGPFRLKEYVAGQRLILERNPYYWKTDTQGHRLPYLNELVFLFVPSADAQVLRFQSGETDMISRLGARRQNCSGNGEEAEMVPRRAVPASGVGCSGPRGDRAPGVSRAWRSALGTRHSRESALDRCGDPASGTLARQGATVAPRCRVPVDRRGPGGACACGCGREASGVFHLD